MLSLDIEGAPSVLVLIRIGQMLPNASHSIAINPYDLSDFGFLDSSIGGLNNEQVLKQCPNG
jgi:hypothetical protein